MPVQPAVMGLYSGKSAFGCVKVRDYFKKDFDRSLDISSLQNTDSL